MLMQKYISSIREAVIDNRLLLIIPDTMDMRNKAKSPIFQVLRYNLNLLVNTPIIAYRPGIMAVYGDRTNNNIATNVVYASLNNF